MLTGLELFTMMDISTCYGSITIQIQVFFDWRHPF